MSNADSHDLSSLLSGSDRDYLIRNNNDQVKIDSLKGKKVGLYFSASWCGPCHRFTPKLVEAYNELGPQANFEVVFVSGDEDEESFQAYFSKMPWLAVPFSDSDVRDRLDDVFKVNGIPHLVILNENGDVSTEDGVAFIREFGAEGYPFTQEKLKELQEKEKEAKRNQTLKSVLAFGSRDYVISSNGDKVPVSELEGKTVALYFVLCSYPSRSEFTKKLAEVYEKLKAKGEKFEIVLVPLDDDEEAFNQLRGAMPWLALPVNDKNIERLAGYFEISFLPTVVILGPDGKTLHPNVAEAIEEHGVNAYPFTPEKFLELAEVEKARAEAQTLESILVKGDLDFVLGKDGYKIPVADLVGKNVCLYFSAHWCPPCRAFLPKLVEAYNEIKAKDDAFEVIFISSDRDQASYDEYFRSMPWLALPFGDERKKSLSKTFKVQGIPMLVALGPSGRTVNTKARELIMVHGGDAYPFTDERVKELEAKFEEMKKGWPEKIKHELHDKHELVLTRFTLYCCDGCNEEGHIWSFHCEECNFDLHPKCALKEDKETKDDGKGEQTPNEEWICDGDVCKRA